MSAEFPEKRCKILLVEDNESDVYLFRRAMKKAGMDVDLTVIRNSEEAHNFIKKPENYSNGRSYDLAVLDLNIPGDSGLVLLEEIRTRSEFKKIPVAVMTSSESPKDREEAKRLGANKYILKPHGIEGLGEVTETLKQLMVECES
jgi:CheY-like chemotaxis protein